MFALLAASLALVGHAVAQDDPVAATPLASKDIPYTAIPYQVDTDPTGRGPQFGYNICNSTTEGPTSNCQTAYINSADDWCVWGPPTPGSDVGTTEAASVAWCTKPGHGTRIIPAGAVTGLQFMKTPGYLQITGYIQQDLIDMDPNDGGGEMDPHGADERGNPLGGLVYSNGLPASNGNAADYVQIKEWHNFMGSGVFCFKACDPSGPNPAALCQHIFDLIGCQYNAPAAYVDGVFESCLGDNQDPPGIYTGADGVVSTYTQPPEADGVISTMPYTPKIPASSSCTTYSSAQLFSGQPSPSIPISVSGATVSSLPASTGTAAAATNKAATPASHASSSTSATASAKPNGAAAGVQLGAWSVVVGVVGAAVGALVAL